MKITIQQIKEALLILKIPYEINGQLESFDGFYSFRKPQNNGIYYAVGDFTSEISIEDSLIICEMNRLDFIETHNSLIIVNDSQLVFYLLLQYFYPKSSVNMKHPTAIIDKTAIIEADVEIGPYCIIGKARIRKGTILKSHVAIYDKTDIGENVTIEPHSVIGTTGTAWIWDYRTKQRIVQPQLGGVKVGNNVFIGSNVSIARGSLNENTEIGQCCIIAPGSNIGHGCRLGDFIHFANNVTLAGNVDIGDRSFLGSGVVVRPQIQLASDSTVGAGAVVVKSVIKKNQILVGVPAKAKPNPERRLQGVPASL